MLCETHQETLDIHNSRLFEVYEFRVALAQALRLWRPRLRLWLGV